MFTWPRLLASGLVTLAACGGASSSDPYDAGDTAWSSVDGGLGVPDAPQVDPGRFATRVVSFTPGACAGFGQDHLPDIVLGPPEGGGGIKGSLDVLSLGNGGVVTVAVEGLVDLPGADFIVFENPFFIGGNASRVYAEPGEVSVSNDGITWATFPCDPTLSTSPGCAGRRPVYASEASGISPFDLERAGGDPFDLADIGVTSAQFVRIRDRTEQPCSTGPGAPTMNGFDLDAVAVLHAP
ncbi:MAG: cell surface protein [Myxococcales bacterium]